MLKQKYRILRWGVWLSLFIAIFAYCQHFLSLNYPFVEQFTFFRFSTEYAVTTLNEPGGLANYLADFLSQFYIIPAMGPLISAVLSVLLTALLDLSLKQISSRYYLPLLSALPALACIWLETDFNYYLAGTVSLVCAMAAFWLYLKSRSFCALLVRLPVLALLSWPLYYLLGPNALLCVVLCVWTELRKSVKLSMLSLLVLPVAVACPVLLYHMDIGKDLLFQLLPKGYYHENLQVGILAYLPWIGVLLNVGLAKCVAAFPEPANPEKLPLFDRLTHKVWVVGLQFVLVLGCMNWGVQHYNSETNYEVKIFDHYVRTGQWTELLLDKHLRAHKNMMHTCYQNLALSSLNLMGDKFFACSQTGPSGLFIKWNKTVNSSTLLSDVYWQVGDVALAQEMAFEGMVASRGGANPRLLMRLLQTNLVAGNYPVAEKYLNLLADTYSYADKAESYRKMLYNEEAILADAELGPRKIAMKASGLTNGDQIVEDLGYIIQHNPSFVPAFHYYGVITLLMKDIPSFKQFIEKYHTAPALSTMPVHFQEAIILAYEEESDRWTELGVTPQVKKRFANYREQYIAFRSSPMIARKMAAGFRDTYWYYYMFKK